jgi:hypothetical protein
MADRSGPIDMRSVHNQYEHIALHKIDECLYKQIIGSQEQGRRRKRRWQAAPGEPDEKPSAKAE